MLGKNGKDREGTDTVAWPCVGMFLMRKSSQ